MSITIVGIMAGATTAEAITVVAFIVEAMLAAIGAMVTPIGAMVTPLGVIPVLTLTSGLKKVVGVPGN
jgi:hypothetical protein